MMEKIFSLRGILYRKLKEAEKKKGEKAILDQILPGFAVMKPKRIVELPDVEDITKLDVIYPLLEPFAYARINWNPETKELIYNVLEPKLSEEEKQILKKISEGLIELVDVELSVIKQPSKIIEYLEKNALKVIKELGIKLTQEQYIKIMYYLYRNFVGLNEIEPFMQDPNIEDISCDGVGIPFYVVHRKYGSIKTNVMLADLEELRELVVKLAERCGRYVSYAEPILDGTLPDGSLDYEEPIIFKENGLIKIDKIGRLVDKFYVDGSFDSPVEVKNIEVPAFDPNFKVAWKPVNYVYRHKHDGKLIKLILETNRSVVLTPSHSIFVLRKNGLVAMKTSEVKVGDFVAIPLKIPEAWMNEINLIEKFARMEFSKNLFISNVPKYVFEEKKKKILDFLKKYYKNHQQAFKEMERKRKLPFKLYTLLKKDELKKVKLEEKFHPKVKLPSILPLSKELMRLLGYYVAEGWMSEAGHDFKIFFSFGSNEKNLIEDVKECAKKCFNADVYVERRKNEARVKLTSKLAYFLFKDILQLSRGAKKKEVPTIVLNAKRELKEEFIKAWWAGDRGSTASEKLVSDVLYLMLLEGKVVSFGKREREVEIGGRKIVSNEFYIQRLLTRNNLNYPHMIPIQVFNSLNKTHIKFSNKRISRERLKALLDDARYARFEKLNEDLPIQFFIEWEKRGILKKTSEGWCLSEKGEEILNEIKIVRKILEGDVGFVKVKKIEEVEPSSKFVYDVSVKGLENFVGGKGGIFCHNSRVAATLAADVATRGPVITIRKFGEKPFSPIEQIEMKTASPEVLAYFWYLMEHGVSVLVIGGVATGKTSFLNTLCMFIPPEAKIISIEDTRELRIPNEHWVPTLARPGFGIPMPSGEKYGGVSLFDLLKESFRQNPDYVIVGETRGEEAYVMFQGISSGHPSLSTMHAGSVETLIKRLTTPPIELSPTLIEGLDVVVVMVHAREKGKSARRIREIVEIESVDPKTEEVKYRTVFKWNPEKDEYEKVGDSIKVEKVTLAKGGKVEEAWAEIKRREKILNWMKSKGIKDYVEVVRLMNLYHKDKKKFFELAGEELEEVALPKPKPEPVLVKVEKKEREKKERIPLLKLLGFKILREK